MKASFIKSIYKAVHESGITSHKFTDETWAKVYELRDLAEQELQKHIDGARIIFENVETCNTCKRYRVSIEDEITGEVYGHGIITASFCGTMSQPWSSYDLCASWW